MQSLTFVYLNNSFAHKPNFDKNLINILIIYVRLSSCLIWLEA